MITIVGGRAGVLWNNWDVGERTSDVYKYAEGGRYKQDYQLPTHVSTSISTP